MDSAPKTSPVVWAVGVILALTVYRVAWMTQDGTDLFVDEAQYWAWGQHLDFGYFSKPPLIGWLIRAVTELASSDAAFWVRLPAPLLHGATALLIVALGRAVASPPVGAWAGVLYAACPLVAVGSALISTDTVMLPFAALALWMLVRLGRRASLGDALVLGVALGAGMMAKYAMIYVLLGWALASLLSPAARIPRRDAALALVVALAVIAPNIWWNLAHEATTVRHVVEDNAKWSWGALNWRGAGEFVLSQAVVFGPIPFVALLIGGARMARVWPLLVAVALPVLAVVTVQAVLSRAFANWAAVAFVPGAVLAAQVLYARPLWAWLGQGMNLAVALALPVLVAFPFWLTGPSGQPLLSRYMGLHAVSDWAFAEARAVGLSVVAGDSRALMADLVYRAPPGMRARALPPEGRPRSFYEQELTVPAPLPLAFLTLGPRPCAQAERIAALTPEVGHYAARTLTLWRLPPSCQ
ncbi:MAG: ArnT family glycosyltransferase [Shimia sp.]